jgi:hypothetical protein
MSVPPMLTTVIALVALALIAIVTAHAVLHVAAARDAWLREDACAFDDPEEHTPAAVWAMHALVESAATLCVAACAVLPAARPSRDDGRRSVVVVSGWAMPAGTTAWLARRLRAAGWARVHPIGLGAWTSVDGGVRRLADALATLRATHAIGDVDVVAAGLAGLVARALLRRDGGHARICRLVTLGTPHQGTVAAPWLRIGPWASEVRPDGGPFPPSDGEGIAIASAHDAVLVPATLAYWPGAFNVTIRGVGHVGMLCSDRVFAIVAENLAHEDAAAPRGRTHVG